MRYKFWIVFAVLLVTFFFHSAGKVAMSNADTNSRERYVAAVDGREVAVLAVETTVD